MPSKSKKQHNLMAAVANNPKFAKKVESHRAWVKITLRPIKAVNLGVAVWLVAELRE
jgi:hypothetical protein